MATVPTEYVILDMNANGDSKAGMRDKRKHHIADVLRSESPLVIFLQEYGWIGIHSPAWKDIHVSDYFKYEGHNEAGFIFDTREITYLRIDNKTSVRNMYDSMVRRSDMVSDYFDLPRLCVCKIQSKGAPNFEILSASWHGPYKVSMDKKEKALDTLIEFLLKLKVEEGNVPLLLGGDFNMPASAVKRRLPGSLMLHTPCDSSIDMFIMSSDIERIFSISKVHTMNGNSAFDHLHLEINLKTVNATNLEEQLRSKELLMEDKGLHGGSEQALSPMEKKISPSENESEQKTKGKGEMKAAKGAESKMPKSSEQKLSPTKKGLSPNRNLNAKKK